MDLDPSHSTGFPPLVLTIEGTIVTVFPGNLRLPRDENTRVSSFPWRQSDPRDHEVQLERSVNVRLFG